MLNARRISADGGGDHLVLLAADDVTDRARVADDLLLNGQRKDEFLAMLAHELRHPLTPITHAIYLLRRAEGEPATAALYETIDTETRRLERFVNDLLESSASIGVSSTLRADVSISSKSCYGVPQLSSR